MNMLYKLVYVPCTQADAKHWKILPNGYECVGEKIAKRHFNGLIN